MPETKRKVQTYEVDYICDTCGNGKMRNDGTALLSHPPQYPHTCTNKECNLKVNFRGIKYPIIRTEYIDD